MSELKTIKDMKIAYSKELQGKQRHPIRVIDYDDLRQLTIKWVKEDIKDCNKESKYWIIDRWMKRLNITERDLR